MTSFVPGAGANLPPRTKVRARICRSEGVRFKVQALSAVALVCAGIVSGQSGGITSAPKTISGLDQTVDLQRSIDGLSQNGVLDCGNQHYLVVALRLKSEVTIQNCNFQTVSGAVDFASPVTIDGRTSGVSNIILRNVHVDGNRHGQTNIGYAGEEDGGRHCFRLLGNVSNVLIEDSSGNNCASDGIAMVSYGVSSSDFELPFQNIVIRNSSFSSNRRHGASADGINGVTFENVLFSQNGITVVTGGTEGDRCASSGGQCYGTGFWYEDYTTTVAGEGIGHLTFVRCVFRGNYQRSLFFFARGLASAANYQPRGPISVVNSYLDSGLNPLSDDYAIQFQVDDSLIGMGPAFQDILVQNSVLIGSVGFREISGATLNSSQIKTKIPYLGYAAYSTQIDFTNAQTYGKTLAASYDPFGGNSPLISYTGPQGAASYSASPPQSGAFTKGDVIWNVQSTPAPVGWICVLGGNPCQQWHSF